MKLTLCCWLAGAQLALLSAAPVLPDFDFTQPAVCALWRADYDIAGLRPTAEGLEVTISGVDPYLHGPARDYPAELPLWLVLRVKSEQGGSGQVFFFRDQAREANSAHFTVKPGAWQEVRMMVPALGAGYRLRIDPPGEAGKTVIAALRFEPAVSLTAPVWPKPEPVDFAQAPRLRSGPLEVQVAGRGFSAAIEGRRAAVSHSHPLLGYVLKDQLRWLDLAAPARVEATAGFIKTLSTLRDADGATWQIYQAFTAGTAPGVINLTVTVQADQDRALAFLPLLLLVAGEGSTNKGQALLPGLEYLDNEPSSSEADLIGPESERQVPANHKLAFPLMALQHEGHYLGLVWEHGPQFSALFDSPDRALGTGGHVMGVLFPGSDGYNRREGDLLPMRAEVLRAGTLLTLRAQLIGGAGASVVPALQQYVKLRGLPPVPPSGYSASEYVSFAAHGWLDSKIRETNRFRHALGGSFVPQPAADAAMYLNWLSTKTADGPLRERLSATAGAALAAVPPGQWDSAALGHVRYPVQALVYGHVPEAAEHHRRHAQALLARLRPDGTVAYHAAGSGPDYARTHWTDHANGLSAQVLMTALDAALFAGDRALLDDALAKLRALRRTYAHGVPRGAQTWEVPLHTPDIMASAHLVRAFTVGYQLTGERELLDEAIYWAWTGLPFLYLVNPVGSADPPYGCLTVFGATSWVAPVWMGRPVQWCGLVYADAIYRLAAHDPTGPWKQVADGITAMGLRYSWPAADAERQGLLPDSWEVLAQTRNAPPINPGTVQANAVRLYGQGPLYDNHVFRLPASRLSVHAPGQIVPMDAGAGRVKFTVRAWPQEQYYVLVNGLTRAPQVWINGQPAPLSDPHQFQEKEGRLILKLTGQPTVEAGEGLNR